MTDDAISTAASTSSALAPAPSSVKRLPELTRAAMWWTAIVIAVLTAGAVTVLWWPATAGLAGADLVKARLDALKIGLSIGVGSGGVVALYLAWRRQHSTEADLDNRERALVQQYEVLAHQQDVATTTQAHQERVAADARADAAARRITDLYLKAAELLGSDKAPVRLSGLYALERLAQDNESQRQTIVNVFCAYLRMPYDLPLERGREDSGASAEQCEIYRERSQEREVRLTAQRLLRDHLDPDRGTAYWGELDLDLTGAQLINFTLTHSRIGTSTFLQATFTGAAEFKGATFTGAAEFKGVRFTSTAGFEGATFTGAAEFYMANFTDIAQFGHASFSCAAWFHLATFAGIAQFSRAIFGGAAAFGAATFTAGAWFNLATFANAPDFDWTTFTSFTEFDGATLNGKPFQPTFASDDSEDSNDSEDLGQSE